MEICHPVSASLHNLRSFAIFLEKSKDNKTFLKGRLVAGKDFDDPLTTSSRYGDVSSPTISHGAVMMIAAIAAAEGRHVMTVVLEKFKDIVGFAKTQAYNNLFSVDDISIPLTPAES